MNRIAVVSAVLLASAVGTIIVSQHAEAGPPDGFVAEARTILASTPPPAGMTLEMRDSGRCVAQADTEAGPVQYTIDWPYTGKPAWRGPGSDAVQDHPGLLVEMTVSVLVCPMILQKLAAQPGDKYAAVRALLSAAGAGDGMTDGADDNSRGDLW